MSEKNRSLEPRIEEFRPAKEAQAPRSLEELSPEELARLREAGFDQEAPKEGEFLQADARVVQCRSLPEGLELLPVTEALKKYDWIGDYWWKAVPAEKDEYTKATAEDLDDGYFIRVLPGYRLVYPVTTCLYIRTPQVVQKVHNLIIVEEGAELNLITACTTHPGVRSGFHIGVSEFYVKRNGKLTFTMIHQWSEETHVRPRTGVIVEEGGTYISTYVTLHQVATIQAYPNCRLLGPGARATFGSVVIAPEGSLLDLGARVSLEAPGTRAEIISRSVSTGGESIARGHLIGQAPEIKAHLECQGLMLSDKGAIKAIPQLDAYYANVDMSHEAAVGKIAQEEIEYLMARGLSEEEATSLIVQGFLNVRIEGLPAELQKRIDRAVELARAGL
ncbi:SufD family Fe-S cluster assembly protein [Thermosulfurimonas marina]|uniref:SufD family Fe-S cluster assembly protein n=1 Tax=Thermosulfurimonas marina TaxID=2047767 RepID=A0A6H1WUL1_9BACT|nr:SufD family Fe-S cluster assembly protein [Thermosulfurimonas marina]QJA06887.1 SufD family Fe-S cluster assembly protein [Thermosulfurimonas marina]